MAYTALYRKFRPLTFSAVIGQAHIVRTLKNQLVGGRVSHAYLFCGTRGTGKTSTAKIFARAINCENPQEGEPCNVCKACQAALSGRSLNVIEIDAASNNGVDHIRELREEVRYAPAEGTHKVYIIDEVHMLSTGAFNALLKTLEEPPAHVIFLLATTDPQKIPATILSRCQRFDLHRIAVPEMLDALHTCLTEEGLSAEDAALSYIAQLADGSLRDALSLLDQCVTCYTDSILTLSQVQDLVGSVDTSVFFALTDALWQQNASTLLEMTANALLLGRDIGQILSELLAHLRNLLVAATVPAPEQILSFSPQQLDMLMAQAKKIPRDVLLSWLHAFSALQADLRFASSPRVLFEVTLLKLCVPAAEANYTAVAGRLAALEEALAQGTFSIDQAPTPPSPTPLPTVSPKKRRAPLPEDQKEAIARWKKIKSSFPSTLQHELADSTLNVMQDTLCLVCGNPFVCDDIRKRHLPTIETTLSDSLEREITLRVIEKAEYDRWQSDTYGNVEESKEDAELTSLLKQYFPEAEMTD